MSERWTARNEYLSELHMLRNHLIAQLAEVDMAISRERNAFDAKRAKTVTQETRELLHKAQKPIQLWTSHFYQERAIENGTAPEDPPLGPPYEHLTQ